MRVATKQADRIRERGAQIDELIPQLGEAYRDLLAARSEVVQDAYREGGHNRTDQLNGFFSDTHIRDRIASAMTQAGLGELLDVGSARAHDLGPLSEITDRFEQEKE